MQMQCRHRAAEVGKSEKYSPALAHLSSLVIVEVNQELHQLDTSLARTHEIPEKGKSKAKSDATT